MSSSEDRVEERGSRYDEDFKATRAARGEDRRHLKDSPAQGGEEDLDETLDRERYGSGDIDADERYGRHDTTPDQPEKEAGGDDEKPGKPDE